jgi:hypothetical protein
VIVPLTTVTSRLATLYACPESVEG